MIPLPQKVYTTHYAEAYHTTPRCLYLGKGQDLNDWDCDCSDYCPHRSPRIWPSEETTPAEAYAQGKWPCTHCFIHGVLLPGQLLDLPPSTDTFGHEPYGYDGAFICARCSVRHTSYLEAVAWPCTSAIVLGLAPRTLAALEGE